MRIAVIYRELFLLLLAITTCQNAQTNIHDKAFWYKKNHDRIHERMRNVQINHLLRIRNVVLFIGDGMGISTITASRVFKRQISHNPYNQLTFDDFPATAFVQTDIENSQISESAASSTALFCGVKTKFKNLGVDVTATSSNYCENLNSHTPSIISWAQEKNLKTGFVTTTRVTHATPAALYAHSRRHIENDSKVETHGCKDIARQLIENRVGRKLNVIMGGGMRNLIAKGEDGSGGKREDGRNLTDEWLADHFNGEFVKNKYEMMNINQNTEDVLGIFADSHMHFNADRDDEVEPSLAEMTQTAINVLKRNNQKGFLLVVEAGNIDLAHHHNNAYRALNDTLALDEAVGVALRNLDLSQSMIIVTSDHSSGLSYSGYATPKNFSILGMDNVKSDINNQIYQLLTYSSGIGHQNYNEEVAREDFKDTYHMSTIPMIYANHGAEDVPLYAIGGMSSLLFSGTFDQTYVAHAIAYAMCIFQFESRCYHHRKDAYLDRLKPQHEKKMATGMDALREKLSEQKQADSQNLYPDTEEITIPLTTTLEFDNNPKNDTLSDAFELVSNFTTNDNSSCNLIHGNFVVFAITTLLSINLVL